MNLTTKRINLHRILFSSAALASVLGGMVFTGNSANAIPVTTGAKMDRGINRISVDLRPFVKKEYLNNSVRNNCTANLDSGQLVIKCYLSDYVEGGGYFPFSSEKSNIKPEVKLQEANTNR